MSRLPACVHQLLEDLLQDGQVRWVDELEDAVAKYVLGYVAGEQDCRLVKPAEGAVCLVLRAEEVLSTLGCYWADLKRGLVRTADRFSGYEQIGVSWGTQAPLFLWKTSEEG